MQNVSKCENLPWQWQAKRAYSRISIHADGVRTYHCNGVGNANSRISVKEKPIIYVSYERSSKNFVVGVQDIEDGVRLHQSRHSHCTSGAGAIL